MALALLNGTKLTALTPASVLIYSPVSS